VLTAIDRPTVFAIPHASSQKPYTALRIDLDLEIARQMMAHIDVNECNVAPTASGLTAAVTPELLDCVLRLTRLIERPSEIAVLADLIHREILYRLLSGPTGNSLRQIAPWLARAKGLEGSGVASGALPRAIAHRSTCENGSIYAPSAFS
jgi:hypothetical protein